MNIGMIEYNKVSDILAAHSLTFSDCYQNPDVLKFALKKLFENEYIAVVEKIKTELSGLDDDNYGLALFIQKLSN